MSLTRFSLGFCESKLLGSSWAPSFSGKSSDMSTYSPFQIFCIVFGRIGVLLGPMVMDGIPLHAGGSTFRLDPAKVPGKVRVGPLVPELGVVTALPTSGGGGTSVGAVTVLPARENNGTFAREQGGGNRELLGTLLSLGHA